MHKTDAPNNVAGEFSDGTPPLTPGTSLGAKWHNTVQRELVNVVENAGAGLTLDPNDDGQVLQALENTFGQLAELNTWTAQNTFDGGIALGADDEITFAARTQHFVTGAANFIADHAGVHVISATGEGAFIRNTNGSGYNLIVTAQLRATPGSTITALEIMADTTGAAVNVDQIYLTAQDARTTADSTGYATTRTFASNQSVSWGLGDVLKFRAVTLSLPGDATVPASGIVTLRLRLPEPDTGGATIDFHAAKLTTTRTAAALL